MPEIQKLDLSKIIRRLELIKSLLLLEEWDEILNHIEKMEIFQLDFELKNIVESIKNKQFSIALINIDKFLNEQNRVIVYINPELEKLKLEIKSLETELNNLFSEKVEIEKIIHDFEVRHNKELGELLLRILSIRKDKGKGTPREKEAETDYNNYSREYEKNKNENNLILTTSEQIELKKLYRKASKICHPDVVNDAQKELAHKIFSQLKYAYEHNDIKKIRELLDELEEGNYFISKSNSLNEIQLLNTEIISFTTKIQEIKNELNLIKSSEVYKNIINIGDWDLYFSETKYTLEKQVNGLSYGE